MRRSPLVAAALAFGLLTGCQGVTIPEYSAESVRVLELVNANRENEGCTSLRLDPALMDYAQNWAQNMFDTDDAADEDLTHSDLPNGYVLVGENLAYNSDSSPEAIVAGWMGSPDHRENMLDCDYTLTGVGVVDGYYVQEFATP
jgi:uncharacterized protein YkwD